jgi:hypothetical protein
MTTRQSGRRDSQGRAFAGSQLQVQLYVNRRRSELDAAVLAALAQGQIEAPFLEWRSPLEEHRFKEQMDGGFLRALDLGRLKTKLAEFWPRSGPRWDALAILRSNGRAGSLAGYVLVEGKSYPGEIYGPGCKAVPKSPQAELISKSLRSTKHRLGIAESSDWSGQLYQYANRLAHVCFLREKTGMPVWLVNLCFTQDPRTPHSEQAWRTELNGVKSELGCGSEGVPFTVDVLLPARSREELLAPATSALL